MNEERFPDPQTFKPERYTDFPLSGPEYAAMSGDDARDHWGYGYGRRICVGMHIVSHPRLAPFPYARLTALSRHLGRTLDVHQHRPYCLGFQYFRKA